MEPRIVITGMGIVSAAGVGIEATLRTLRETPPRPVPVEIPGADSPAYAFRAAPYSLGELVPPRRLAWLPSDDMAHERDLSHLVASVALAIDDAGLPLPEEGSPDTGVVVANEHPGVASLSRALFALPERLASTPSEQFDELAPSVFRLNSFLPPHYIARTFRLWGPSMHVNSACASSLNAIDVACAQLRRGRCDRMIVAGGDDPVNAATLRWFRDRGLCAGDGRIRPFDRQQTGTVFGDGAAAIVLEDRERAERRGARMVAEVLGAGFAQDGWKIRAPHPTRGAGERAVRGALAEASATPDDVELVVPHGMGVPASDQYEARVLHAVFGSQSRWPEMTALKPLVGHVLGGCSLVETVIALSAMERGLIPPTRGHELPYERFPLRLTTEWQAAEVGTLLKLTCAFAGFYAATLFRRDGG